MTKHLVLVAALAAALAACGTSEESAPLPADEGAPPSTEATEATAPAARTASWQREDLVDYTPRTVAPRRSPDKDGEPLGRAELAEALRPVIETAGGLKTTAAPNWTAADAVLRSGEKIVAYDPGKVTAQPPRLDAAAAAPSILSTIIGPDDRTRVTNTTVPPFSSMALLAIFKDGGWYQCSGTYVGPWTVLTAGHCLRTSTGGVASRITFEPARNGGLLPFGSFACANDDTSRTNDFTAALPAAYAGSADSNFDFAVIDTYPCHVAQRWLGQPASNAGIWVSSGDRTYALHGYPGSEPCPGAPGGWNYLCGSTGDAYVNGNWYESQFVDASAGQSGGAWHFSNRVAGTLIGYREYFDLFRCGFDACRRIFGRRIDAAYKSFIDEISYDYP